MASRYRVSNSASARATARAFVLTRPWAARRAAAMKPDCPPARPSGRLGVAEGGFGSRDTRSRIGAQLRRAWPGLERLIGRQMWDRSVTLCRLRPSGGVTEAGACCGGSGGGGSGAGGGGAGGAAAALPSATDLRNAADRLLSISGIFLPRTRPAARHAYPFRSWQGGRRRDRACHARLPGDPACGRCRS